MTTLLILRGAPGSGKSTYAREWVDEAPERRVRINRDDIRFMLFGKYWGVDERAVTRVQDTLLRSSLSAGKDVVLDNTNLQAKNVVDVLKIANEFDGVDVQHLDFHLDFESAVARDLARDRTVGADVIRSFYDRFLGGIKSIGFPAFPELPGEWQFEPFVQNEKAPKAIILDIDGTLAHHEGIRNPYDTTRYHLDTFDHTVATFAEAYADIHNAELIVVSGRDAAYRDVLVAWLEKHDLVVDEIFMRSIGDTRNDAVIKYEIYKNHLEGLYNIVAVFDDRPRVVRMLQKIGLKVFNVGKMDFEF